MSTPKSSSKNASVNSGAGKRRTRGQQSKEIQRMLVRDHMGRKVISTEPTRTVGEARTLLRRHRIRQLPVLRKEKLVGIVTDRDLRSAGSDAKKIADVMTAKPFTISPNASVDEAARLLRTYKIGALPVLEEKRLIGILTGSDILDAFVDLSGVAEPTFRLVIDPRDVEQPEETIRQTVIRHRAELKWLHPEGRRSQQIHLRVRARRVDDLVDALEAAGFDVTAVVAAGRGG